MYDFSIYYIEAVIACFILFGILLVSNHFNIDRQEKQIKFSRALIAFMLYFAADCFWAAIVSEMIPKTRFSVVLDTFALYVFMAGISYFWLDYVQAVEKTPNRNRMTNRIAVIFPFLVTTAVLILNYIIAPSILISADLEVMPLFSIYLMLTPTIYLAAILFYTMRKAAKEENPIERRKHLFIGLFPLLTLVGGMIQEVFFQKIPIYCFIDSLLMLVFYIQSIEARVSLDPLTNLNNRGELMRYTSQRSNLHMEGRLTIVIMMDIDRFKMINDTYGHAEGDKALVIVAESLRKVINGYSMPSFIGRYGGDEFILIIHPEKRAEADRVIGEIRDGIDQEAKDRNAPYALSLSIGYHELSENGDTFQECVRRADEKLYQEKRRRRTQKVPAEGEGR